MTTNTKTIFNFKTDKKLKTSAQKVAEKMGVPLSTVINAFLKRFVADEAVTFSTSAGAMTPYLTEIVEAAKKDIANDKNLSPVFNTAKEAIAYLRS